MKPSAIRIERMLEKTEARLVPPPRKCLQVIIHEGEDDEAEAMAKALAEHVARHPEDVGRTVEDFNWIVWEIVHPKFIIGADGRVRWPAETIEEGECTDKDTDKDTDASETPEPIDLPPPDPGFLARSKPWRPVHQRPARHQRRPTWKRWSGNGGGNGHGGGVRDRGGVHGVGALAVRRGRRPGRIQAWPGTPPR